ncbi:DUF2515 family protein [Collimonas sp.]|jgi:hypothetical protein|uniref:DUF2515 family protein n=1 Tax=Collimonas sp. TaxID=1963772 RepID=UPI002BBEB1A9|nr:hypothetical protein [Collimonas sp.]HWW99810.1 hypothetical protein [Collimonas sp.]
MADATTIEAMTNDTPESCVKVHCGCETMWSLAQQFSYLRLSTVKTYPKATLIGDYAVRARRISATYARFYLEQEENGQADKKGRFYWMALGAFASKTVACTLEDWRVETQAAVVSKKTKEGLGKGNFWLFCDISGWHWYYCMYPDTFDSCLDKRNSDKFVPEVQVQTAKMPWHVEALSKINNLQVSKEIRSGFAKVKEFENETKDAVRRKIQLDHLLDIADHEQGVILQPLIYTDPDFSYWLGFQRKAWVRWATPNLELVFNSACSTGKSEYKSVAPDDTKLEDFKSRMKWIGSAAKDFHSLMGRYPAYMEGELRTMASWVDMADK